MDNNFHIEVAKEQDEADIYTIYHSLINSSCGTWDEDYPDLNRVKQDLRENTVFLLKNDQKEIISSIVIEESDEFDSFENIWYADVKRWVQLSRLGVRDDKRGMGIGRYMVETAIKHVSSYDYEAVRFLVCLQNTPAQRSYSKLGFDIAGEVEAWGNRWLCYQKRLKTV